MQIINLYKHTTDGMVIVSPIMPDVPYTLMYRLVADEGRAITDGSTIATCIDISVADADKWNDCDIVEEIQSYTEEQLVEMTNAELFAICTELGISESMTKANMISLILQK